MCFLQYNHQCNQADVMYPGMHTIMPQIAKTKQRTYTTQWNDMMHIHT